MIGRKRDAVEFTVGAVGKGPGFDEPLVVCKMVHVRMFAFPYSTDFSVNLRSVSPLTSLMCKLNREVTYI